MTQLTLCSTRTARALPGVAVLALLLSASPVAAQTVQILHASDLEGGVEAIDRAPAFAAVVEALETGAAPSFLISAGDNYIPGPFFSAAGDGSLRSVFAAVLGNPSAREGVGRADITVMNLMGFDASCLGNHEFDAGTSAIADIIGTDIRPGDPRWLGAQFPYLSANLDFSADGALSGLFTPEILDSNEFRSTLADLAAAATAPKLASAALVTKDGVTLGVVGGTTPLLGTISSPGDTTVREPGAGTNDMAQLAAILQPVIDDVLATGVDKIVLVTHLQQIALEQELVPLLRGVDIAIAGGSDTLLADGTDVLRAGDVAAGPYPIVTENLDGDPAVVVSTDGQYSYVGRLVVDFDAAGRIVSSSVDATVSGAYATTADVVATLWGAEDPYAPGTKGGQVKTLTDAVRAIVTEKDGNVQGRTDVFLEGRRTAVRTEETNMGNLTADANLAAAQALDPTVLVSLKNGGGIRAPIGYVDGYTGEELPPLANPEAGKESGEISQLDIENTLRFNNGLSLLTLTAAQLVDVLEHGVADSDPGNTPGRFPQVSGVSFSFDPARSPMDRVRNVVLADRSTGASTILWEGEYVGDPERPIRIVTLDFLAGGGDGYPYDGFVAENPEFANRVDLGDAGLPEGDALFAPPGTEQDAIAEYLRASFAEVPYAEAETDVAVDTRIQNILYRDDAVNPLPPFVRGDATGDARINMRDGIAIVHYLFLPRRARRHVDCLDAADVNDDGRLRLDDALQLFAYLFFGVREPAVPFPACGVDPSDGDRLDCDEYDPCAS